MTNDIKLTPQIACAYLGCDVLYGFEGKNVGKLTGSSSIFGLEIFDSSRVAIPTHHVSPDLCKLILTSVYDMSKEHLRIIADMHGVENSWARVFANFLEVIDSEGMSIANYYIKGSMPPPIIDKLRELGYDLGYGEERSLIEAGLAISSIKK